MCLRKKVCKWMNYTDGCRRQFGNDYGGGVNLGSEKKLLTPHGDWYIFTDTSKANVSN
jgi:hypothetical protein